MVARTLWLWLSLCWTLTWLTEAVINTSSTSICDLGPCRCTRGKLICDCSASKVQNIVLREMAEYSLSYISVSNCGHVHVTSRALSVLPALQQVSATNITKLTLEEQAFHWTTDNPRHSGLLVNITDSAVPEIPSYCFRGSLREILFTNSNLSHIQAFAFSAIDHAERIEFTRVHFGQVESQAFKKFSVDYLSVSDSSFTILPTRTIVDVEVHKEVVFDHVKIDTIKYLGFKIHGTKNFRVVKSVVDRIEKQAFHVHTRGPVSVRDNLFLHVEKSAFAGFTVERRFTEEFGKQELMFENNTLINLESAALVFNTTGFSPRLDTIVINQTCSCPEAEYWISEFVYFSSNPLIMTPAPQVSTVMYCVNGKTNSNVKDFQRLFCNVRESNVFFTIAIISLSVISLSALGVLVYCCLKDRAKRYINVPSSPSPLKQNKNHMLVVPDGKTYRETELHVIVEHVEPIVPTEYILTPPTGEGDFKA